MTEDGGQVIGSGELAEAVATPLPQMDKILRMVRCGQTNAAIAMARMERATDGFFAHSAIVEIYHVISGRGTHFSGGRLVDPQAADYAPTGPGFSSARVEGGALASVGPGDVVVVPRGTPHAWTEIAEPVTYLVVRIDPGGVLVAE